MYEGINHLAIWAAAAVAFVFGGLWYSPLLFLKPWMQGAGLTEAELEASHPGKVYGLGFLLALLSAYVFAMFLGPSPEPAFSVAAGVSAGAFFVAASFGINYLFEQKSFRLWLVNGGYHTAQFSIYGVVLGFWH